jgi:hypothetical protein
LNAPFTEEENTKLMKVAKDFDIGMVYCKGHATLMAQDGIPLPLDPFEPSNEYFLWDNLCFFVDDMLILSLVH